eukprot:CAMPEP_0198199036 /NCGR_PEP_ID=MMETSP1445-20131203/2374_1 /TAXON_ID=36898 /ORGANISM="Pyramimonas sp., Strain CCMP2087" /LENGTH=111 /DNA_ID=CAMNT_0043868745 /DNA_START=267 /DNA_END=599 /DNA_ORIENTATION=+
MSTAAFSSVILLALSGLYLGFAAEQIETGYAGAMEMQPAPEPAALEEYFDKPSDLPALEEPQIFKDWGRDTRNDRDEYGNMEIRREPPVRRPVVTRKTPSPMGTPTPNGTP